MSFLGRPYIGTWRLNNQQLVQHTPDALVFINGDLTLPGCSKCRGRIDLQKFLTEVSVDAGTEAGSHSATFSVSIPLHHSESFARDANFILRPGLEVNVYMRGYFPVKGLYSSLAEPRVQPKIVGGTTTDIGVVADTDTTLAATEIPIPPTMQKLISNLRFEGKLLTVDQKANVEAVYQQMTAMGLPAAFSVAAINQARWESNWKATAQNKKSAYGLFQLNVFGSALGTSSPNFMGGKKAGTTAKARAQPTKYYDAFDPYINSARIATAAGKKPKYHSMTATPATMFERFFFSGLGAGTNVKDRTKGEWRNEQGRKMFGSAWDSAEFSAKAKAEQDWANVQAVAEARLAQRSAGFQDPQSADTGQSQASPSLLEETGLAGLGIEDTMAYPYYHVFHGVVTSVSHSYSGGVNAVSVTCSSMLHFWQYHNMSTNASLFGARPTNSKNKMSLVGNNFTGMHPYSIIHALHYDMAGAAGGIGFALASKSNQTAKASSGESLFSLNVRYWERRFAQGTRLRMHGATGELFSTMAATWLSRRSAGAMIRALRQRYNTAKDFKTTNIGSQMYALGLYGGPNVRAALDATKFADKSKPTTSAKFEINILEMQAFVSNIGDWGQVNLFESTYESKLDVANKVCEITGFEFYQDVDGDFVFKPPMWNLDTSGSRVYRIDDIDIINISFQEAEPQFTYMTVKGTAFKNILGTGTDNEWGVRGQYLDYRLIAQFGWRPGSYETNYFNDPKSMFFAAVNRMDVMNIAVNSASVTIPIRPELRPGYPVYIPYLDCFYYCNSFAHSHSIGGQCTTTLQLVGKRAKFYAPGTPSMPGDQTATGIHSIKLGDTLLPERPLEVRDAAGKPCLSGFPNVVMALDPTAINPLFFVVGTDIENISDIRVIKYLIATALQLRVIEEDKDEFGTYYLYPRTIAGANSDESTVQKVRFFLEEGNLDPSSTKSDKGVNIMVAAQKYMNELAGRAKADEKSTAAQIAAQQEINNLYRKLDEFDRDPKYIAEDEGGPLHKQREALFTQAEAAASAKAKLDADLQAQKTAAESKWRDPDQHREVSLLLGLMDDTGEKYRGQANFQGRGDLSSSINLLDMLSDKKATFSNGQQPGMYRYYSASHPDPKEQGPKISEYKDGKVLDQSPAKIEGDKRIPPTIQMYALAPQGAAGENPPEAELVPGKPTCGIRVLTSNPTKPYEVFATSEITELMFTTQDVTVVKNVTKNVTLSQVSGVGSAVEKKIAELLQTTSAGTAMSLSQLYAGPWADLQSRALAGLQAAKSVGAAANPPVLLYGTGVGGLPGSVTVGTGSVLLADAAGAYKFQGSSGKKDLGKTIAQQPMAVFTQAVARSLSVSFRKQVETQLRAIGKAAKAKNPQVAEAMISAFNASFLVGAPSKASTKGKATVQQMKKEVTHSPVFPVSDGRGYRVVGTYRYGRDVSIDPDGVFDQLHKKDIFSLFSRDLTDQILKFYVEGKADAVPVVQYTKKVKNGKTMTVPVTRTDVPLEEKARYLNGEAVRQLRAANLTEKQILDYTGALTSGKTPNQMVFDLANLFTTSRVDGVQKIPLVNAGYSLADLSTQPAGHVCNCKAAEASMQLEAFGQTGFIAVGSSGEKAAPGYGTDPDDAVNRWVKTQGELAAVQWEQQQQALRGQILDQGGSHVVHQVLDVLGIDTAGAERESLLQQGWDATALERQQVLQAYSAVKKEDDNG